MSDKEALQEIVFMVNECVNNTKAISKNSALNVNGVNAFTSAANLKLINNLIRFLEDNKYIAL